MSREDFIRTRAAAKRAAILTAARARFAADGLEGASVERIAHEAAVSTATLYRQFPSKLALFEAVLRRGLEAFEAALAAAAEAPAHGRLARLAHAYAALLDSAENGGLLRAVFAAAPGSPEVAEIFYSQVKATVASAFHDAVAAAAAAGLIVAQSPQGPGPAGLLMGMIEHPILWRRLLTNQPGDHPPTAIAEAALAAFWAAHTPRR